MRFLPRKANRRIGVVGLGVGTLATYGKTGDLFRFYEINPEVKHLAETVFTYLADTPAKVEIIMGEMCRKCGSKMFIRRLPDYMEWWTGDKRYVS